MTRLRWTNQAVDDLAAILEYIERDSPQYGRAVVERLIERAESTVEFPHAGRVVPEFGREDIRETIVGSYRIVYRAGEGVVTILTVFRSSRLFPLIDLDRV